MFVYALVDPSTREWRYVGKTTRPLSARLADHISAARRGVRRYVYNWIRSLASAPGALEVERCGSPEELAAAEVEWIAEARRLGVRLTNATDGGEGTSGAIRDAETRSRMSVAQTGKKQSHETRTKRSESLRGHLVSYETRSKIGNANRDPSSEVRARKSRARVGKKHSPETLAKMTGRRRSTEARAKMSAAAKIREAKKRGEHVL